jgi:ethanolamine ammonia-lyase small subunit
MSGEIEPPNGALASWNPADMPADTWAGLKRWTDARIAMGRAGGSVPVRRLLDFKLAHAKARDAVLQEFDAGAVCDALRPVYPGEVVLLSSNARNRPLFLTRPDFGRRLSAEARETLHRLREKETAAGLVAPELVIIVSDGLSSLAAHEQVVPLLQAMLPLMTGWRLGPLVVVPYARVALQDEVGELLGARHALILLGERPGLGSPDSLSAYLVHTPKVGNTDAQRNCISNIRQAGLPPSEAAVKITQLIKDSQTLGLSGVALKEGASLSLPQ